MALVEFGVTACPLCQQPINEPEDFIAFPHFIEDEQDSLWPYSDAAFHKWCFDEWSRKSEFLERLRSFEKDTRRP
jgi:hypothetical protein